MRKQKKNTTLSERVFGRNLGLVALAALVVVAILSLDIFNKIQHQVSISAVNVWVIIVFTILFSAIGIILIARDILLRESRKMENTSEELKNLVQGLKEKVKGTTRELETIIDNFTDGLIMTGKQGRIRLINPAAEKLLDISQERYLGKKTERAGRKKQDIVSQIFSLFRDPKSAVPQVQELTVEKPQEKIFQITNLAIYHSKDKYIGALKIIHDITREKFIDKLKTEFISIAAHQLRTPLAGIKWSFETLLGEGLGKISSEQKKFLKDGYKTSQQMTVLVDDLLNVSKIEGGKFLGKFSLQSMTDLVKEIITTKEAFIQRKKIKLNFAKPKEELPKIKVDVEKVSLAVSNILDNAIKYTSKGGKIDISIKRIKDKIKLVIRDSGIGIPKQEKDRIFSKFFRGKKAAKQEIAGTGLGLFIAKNIVEAHKGRIGFESEIDKGTSFWFELPMSS